VRVLRAQHWTLPDRREGKRDGTNQESSQAPLAYMTAALIMDFLQLPPDPGTPHSWDGVINS